MQKISPLRASIEALNKFKTNTNTNFTSPIGLNFKGAVVQMDVFEGTKTNFSVKNYIKNIFSFMGNYKNKSADELKQMLENELKGA